MCKELNRYFAVPVGGLAAGTFFPQQQTVAMDELGRLSARAEDLMRRYDDEAPAREFAEHVPGHIDRIMAALGRGEIVATFCAWPISDCV